MFTMRLMTCMENMFDMLWRVIVGISLWQKTLVCALRVKSMALDDSARPHSMKFDFISISA